MSFTERHEKIVKKVGTVNPVRQWVHIILFSAVLFVLITGYKSIINGSPDVFDFNLVLAETGMFLIGFSLALSGITYFWDFLDTKLIYRKNLGLAGFYFVLVHATFSFIFYFFVTNAPNPNFNVNFSWAIGPFVFSNLIAFFAGLTSLLIFAGMALISNKYSMLELGGVRWRTLLRLGGYSAYLIIVIHFGLKRFELWQAWFNGKSGSVLPPLSLILLLFVLLVFGLRIWLYFSLLKKKREKAAAAKQVAAPVETTNPANSDAKPGETAENSEPYSPEEKPEQETSTESQSTNSEPPAENAEATTEDASQ